MKTSETKQTNIQEKRSYLKSLSKPIQMAVKEGVFPSVNEGLKMFYAQSGHNELKTLREWNKHGKRVKKGEKALLLWGSPKKSERVNEEIEEKDALDFYPICFVFSQKQVDENKKGGKQ